MGDKCVINRIVRSLIFDLSHINKNIIDIYINFLKNKLYFKLKTGSWMFDLSSEDFFWRRNFYELSISNPDIPPYSMRSNESKKSIQLALAHIKNKFDPPYRCIDIGCGPTSQFFTNDLMNRADLEIITVDPLAETYSYLHNKYKTNYSLKCLTGYGELLTDLFPKNHFHLVYTQNAIDHSKNPEEFLRQLYLILIKGGYLILYGFIKEGTAARWLGLHQWDIEVEKGHLLLTDRNKIINKKNIIISHRLELVFEDVSGTNIGDTYTLIYKKY